VEGHAAILPIEKRGLWRSTQRISLTREGDSTILQDFPRTQVEAVSIEPTKGLDEGKKVGVFNFESLHSRRPFQQ